MTGIDIIRGVIPPLVAVLVVAALSPILVYTFNKLEKKELVVKYINDDGSVSCRPIKAFKSSVSLRILTVLETDGDITILPLDETVVELQEK